MSCFHEENLISYQVFHFFYIDIFNNLQQLTLIIKFYSQHINNNIFTRKLCKFKRIINFFDYGIFPKKKMFHRKHIKSP